MGLFNGLKNLFVAKSNEAEQKIEDANIVAFSEEDIRKMKSELAVAKDNFAKIKATKMQIERDIATKEEELNLRKGQAKDLKADPAKLELAQKVAEICMKLIAEIDNLKKQLANTEKVLAQQEANVHEYGEAVDEAIRDLQEMKAQEQVTKSTESLATINADGASSVLAKFQERKRKIQNRMDVAQAHHEADTAGNLDAQVDAALGTKQLASKNFLDSL